MEERLMELLRLALKYGASDIHLSIQFNEIEIMMRIDGELRRVKAKYGDDKLIHYLQYRAGLDVGSLYKPQTGQFEIEVDGNVLSLRFALVISGNNEDGVIRILNNNLKLDSHHLSLLESQNKYFESLFKNKSGLVIFSGPTGSGKTTTLYTLLNAIDNKKIFSIEDPIEVFNSNMIQLQVNEDIGFGYSDGIKQILRHDPDIILIGEIRDADAANMAVIAANTGHLVLASLHSPKASSCINRLIELGVNESHLYDVLLALINQRLMITSSLSKQVIYEIMDKKEIDYYHLYHDNSSSFISLDSQIKEGIINGLFKRQ